MRIYKNEKSFTSYFDGRNKNERRYIPKVIRRNM